MASDKDQYGHPRIPYRGLYDRERCDKRRKWIEKFTNCQLSNVGEWWSKEGVDENCSCDKLRGNIENPIGLAKIPIGIAGPLLIRGDHINGYALCTFATTEGALVASATRGAALLTRAGGVTCRVLEKNMSRMPVLVMESIHDAEKLRQWAQTNVDQLQVQISDHSQHTRLLNIKAYTLGCFLYLLFVYDTGDAAGQNMVTLATWNCCSWLQKISEKEIGVKIKQFIVATAGSGEKKLSFHNYLNTRGVHVVAEAWIPDSLIKSTLKTSADELFQAYRYFLHSNFRTGAMGVSVNPSNALASVFIATGQDVGCVGESSPCYFLIEPASVKDIEKHCSLKEEGLYVCYELPSLAIGTVGGGTSLPTQRECLEIMGCYGQGGVYRLAEIIAGYCMSLDISTLGALANGTFHLAHEKLGRNRPDAGLRPAHLDKTLFQTIIGERGNVIEFRPFSIDTRSSVISDISKTDLVKLVGHFGYDILYKNNSGDMESIKLVIKSKPTDSEICNMLNKIARRCGSTLATVYERNKGVTGFRHCSEREVAISSLNIPAINSLLPETYYASIDIKKEVYIIVMEYLVSDKYTLLNTTEDISVWTETDIKVVLRDIAHFHAAFFSSEFKHVLKSPWLEEMGRDKMTELQPLWTALLDHAHLEFPEFWTDECCQLLEKAIKKIPELWLILQEAEKTLIHNDCNPRNICLRFSTDTTSLTGITGSTGITGTNDIPFNDSRSLCMYDWELCRVDVPQHDLVEFLAFVLPPDTSITKRTELIECYRLHLEYYTGKQFPIDRFMKVYNVACLDFAINRLLMYTMVHTFKDYSFLPRVITSHMNYLREIASSGEEHLLFHSVSKL